MSQNEEPQVSYTDEPIDKLEGRWGEGFRSPGGPPEVAELLRPGNLYACRGS